MFNKRIKKIGLFAMTVIVAAAMQVQPVKAVSGLSLGVSAGADNVLSQGPSLLQESGQEINVIPEIRIDSSAAEQ